MQDDQRATPGPPDVDLEQARRFLDQLDPGSVFTFQTLSDHPELKQKVDDGQGGIRIIDSLARTVHGTFDQCANSLVKLNQQGAGAFVMINEGDGVVHEGNRTCRTKANVVSVRAAFVDLDGAPIQPVLSALLPPHWIVQPSLGRWHAYWRVRNCPLTVFSAVQTAMAAKFGGDGSVKDLPRVMRPPGFLHQKGTPIMSQLYLHEDYPRLTENQRD